jgi:dTDP-4-dehydrorhamnose reductase
MRLLVTGSAGMVGSTLLRHVAERAWEPLGLSRAELDITDGVAVERRLETLRPDAVINAAAYTAVDAAERDADGAMRANRDGPAVLARACMRFDIPLLHLSTDYVFDGGQSRPYRPSDPVAPLNVYGWSKLAGEEAVRALCPRHLIVRTSWVLSIEKSFVRTVLRVAEKGEEMRIVANQRGSPTAAHDLAVALVDAMVRALERPDLWGTYHFANDGEATWYEVATEILRLLLPAPGVGTSSLRPVTSEELGAAARRPKYSVLDTGSFTEAFDITPRPWREALGEALVGAAR